MPVTKCSKDGMSGYRWGTEGKCYTYVTGDQSSRAKAYEKARKQGAAIEARKGEEND
jgi:hypothetical protein